MPVASSKKHDIPHTNHKRMSPLKLSKYTPVLAPTIRFLQMTQAPDSTVHGNPYHQLAAAIKEDLSSNASLLF